MSEWIDDFLEDLKDVNELANLHQIGMIESLLDISPTTLEFKTQVLEDLNELTVKEASIIISELKENEISRDPKHQYKKMKDNGMFD